LLDELYRECFHEKPALIVEREDVDKYTKFVYDRAREFYWTVTRLIGFGHWHDGSLSNNRPSVDVPVQNTKTSKKGVKKGLRLNFQGHFPAPATNPRILIDITATYRDNRGTGIQRVVQKVAEAAIKTGFGTPFFIEDGRIRRFHAVAGGLDEIELCDGDVFVWIDAGWNHSKEYQIILDLASRKNCSHVLCIYDILPILYPKGFTPHLVRDFEAWFKMMAPISDAMVAISKSVADEFCEQAALGRINAKHDVRVGWFQLGADFPSQEDTAATEQVQGICSNPTPFFLAVGTIEPRKGYSIILAAFEKLWGSGVDVCCVIVGRPGWGNCALEERIRAHEEYGRRLHWLVDANDCDLRSLYGAAHRLIAASFAEGFGLPIVEASLQGCHVIASDINVFREVGQDKITYFNLLDPDHLAERIHESLQGDRGGLQLPIVTWEDACRRFFDMINFHNYQYEDRPAWPPKI
jgi:alpha-1,2-rhamnosyltransferase